MNVVFTALAEKNLWYTDMTERDLYTPNQGAVTLLEEYQGIEDFNISPNTYDLILAVSALEHIDSKESFVKKLEEIREGIKAHGVVCLVVNSEVREKNKETGEMLVPQFEVNLPTEELQEILQKIFAGWEVLKSTVRGQQYDIPRDGCTSDLRTNVVSFVTRKREEIK